MALGRAHQPELSYSSPRAAGVGTGGSGGGGVAGGEPHGHTHVSQQHPLFANAQSCSVCLRILVRMRADAPRCNPTLLSSVHPLTPSPARPPVPHPRDPPPPPQAHAFLSAYCAARRIRSSGSHRGSDVSLLTSTASRSARRLAGPGVVKGARNLSLAHQLLGISSVVHVAQSSLLKLCPRAKQLWFAYKRAGRGGWVGRGELEGARGWGPHLRARGLALKWAGAQLAGELPPADTSTAPSAGWPPEPASTGAPCALRAAPLTQGGQGRPDPSPKQLCIERPLGRCSRPGPPGSRNHSAGPSESQSAASKSQSDAGPCGSTDLHGRAACRRAETASRHTRGRR
jgi:hypothetical protein